MKKIALLISDNLIPETENAQVDIFELDEEVGKLVPALANIGMDLVQVRWREIAERAGEFDAILPLLVWDYFEGNEEAFLTAIAKAEAVTPVLNGFDIIKWNADKSYLDEMEDRGASVIRTLTVDRVTPTNVARAFVELDTDTIVIKPKVGGGAWRQVLHRQGEPFPDAGQLYSHAVRKTPKAGDYRIQSRYGGVEETYTPSQAERDSARETLDVLDFTPLYARVDLLRGRDERLKLIELELIEPYLYFPHAKGEGGENEGAQNFAAALQSALEKIDRAG